MQQANMTDTEHLLLGSLLCKPEGIHSVSDIILPEHFISRRTKEAYRIARDLAAQGTLDVVTFARAFLSEEGDLWPPDDVAGLVERYNSAGYVPIESLAEEVRLSSIKRNAHDIGAKIQHEKDPAVLRELNKELGNALDATHGKPFEFTWKTGKDFIKYLEHGQGRPSGIMTGFPVLDEMTSGFGPGEMCVVGAASKTGKTTWALDVAWNVSSIYPVAFISVEMDKQQLYDKLYGMVSGVQSDKFRRGTVGDNDWPLLLSALERIGNRRLILDFHSRDIDSLILRYRRLASEHGVKLVVVDYCQRVKVPHEKGQSREREVATIAQAIKNVALDTRVPVILLSQISRAGESEDEPSKRHLRESGVLDQEADQIVMMWRGTKDEGGAWLKVDGNRPTGRTGKFHLDFNCTADSYKPYPLMAHTAPAGEAEEVGEEDERIPF